MQCPVCADVTLVMSDRQGIEIDYCPRCRGVWLDRGELDKIIERSTSEAEAPVDRGESLRRRDDRDYDDYKYGGYKGKKKKSLFRELFDFD